MSATPTHAIVLAAGLGKRMRPLTLTRPKPLVEVAGKPLVRYNIDWLREAGITSVVVNTSYMADMLEAYLATIDSVNVRISREEPEPLETGGGIVKALPWLGPRPFVAMNSDAIFPDMPVHPLSALYRAWDDSAMDFLMLLVPRERARGLHGKGDFLRNSNGTIRRPRDGEQADYVFTGLEMIHPRVFTKCPQGAFSLNELWNRSLDADGNYTRVHSVVLDGDWLHVGDIAGLEEAEAYLSITQE